MKVDKFFLYLNRFNAVAIALFVIIGLFWIGSNSAQNWSQYAVSDDGPMGPVFGSDVTRKNSIIGHDVETSGGRVIAYYDSDESFERKELAGLVLVNLETSETLPIAAAGSELLVNFEFLFDRQDEGQRVVGYIAQVATEVEYRQGRSNLIVGSLPAMTKTVVAEDVMFADLPTVRSDGNVALIMWQNEEIAETVVFRLSDGAVVDRAKIEVPIVDPERLSQGAGKSSDARLLRSPGYGEAPARRLSTW